MSESELKTLKNTRLLTLVTKLCLFPTIYATGRPFKILEFKKLMKTRPLNSDVVLDLGCGYGVQTLCIGKMCKRVVGIDIDKARVKVADQVYLQVKKSRKMSCEFLSGAVEDAHFPESSFDKVFSICVIEHIPNYLSVLKEVYRVLKKDGAFAFSVDSLASIDSEEILRRHKDDFCVANYFSAADLSRILAEIGFKDVEVYPILKSNYAKNFFTKGIREGFYFRSTFLFDYARLAVSERLTKNTKGLFLVARCRK